MAEHGQVVGGIFVATLLDILFHELGHHALDNLYAPAGEPTPAQFRTMRRAERNADLFATEQFRVLSSILPGFTPIDENNVIGRIFALHALRTIQMWSSRADFRQGHSHPNDDQRVLHAVTDLDCRARPEVCQLISRYRALWDSEQGSIEAYRRRAASGETFAQYVLGTIEQRNGDYAEGCRLYRQAMSGPNYDRLLLHIAWCHENGYYSGGTPDDASIAVARTFYALEAENGWLEGQIGVDRLANR